MTRAKIKIGRWVIRLKGPNDPWLMTEYERIGVKVVKLALGWRIVIRENDIPEKRYFQ